MNDVAVLALKAVIGGLFVVAFALVGEVLEPKRFAGLFSAAPSVALAGFAVMLMTKGHGYARNNALGMIVGAVAFVAFALVNRPLIRRFDALQGSAISCLAWLAVAGSGYLLMLR